MGNARLADPGNPTTNIDLWVNDAGLEAAASSLTAFAEEVLETCEEDFARLEALFGGGSSFGAENRITVVIDATQGLGAGGALGQNEGFKSGGLTTIGLAANSQLFPPGLSSDQLAEVFRGLFVAELAEVFLSLQSQSRVTLNPGWSDGEAFSRVMMNWLHPVGYQAVGRTAQSASFVPVFPASYWLDQPARPDYVAQHDEWDGDPTSIGCGIVFLYYLHSQLGHEWSDIVNALGFTLADTYSNLQIGTSESAFPTFEALMRRVFPTAAVGSMPYNLPAEDVFPVLEPNRAAVDIAAGTATVDESRKPISQGTVTVRPAPLCPEGRYTFEILPTNGSIWITATSRGFGYPQFTWTVAGEVIADSQYGSTPITYNATGWNDDPLHPDQPVPTTADVSGSASVTGDPGSTTSMLTVSIDQAEDTPAHFGVTVDVSVVETAAGGNPATQSTSAWIDMAILHWFPPFDADRKQCSDRLRDLMKRFTHLRHIILLRTLPDPPSLITRALGLAAQLEDELAILEKHDRKLADALRTQYGLDKGKH